MNPVPNLIHKALQACNLESLYVREIDAHRALIKGSATIRREQPVILTGPWTVTGRWGSENCFSIGWVNLETERMECSGEYPLSLLPLFMQGLKESGRVQVALNLISH